MADLAYKEVYLMNALEARKHLLETYKRTGSISATAREWNCARQTVRKWLARQAAEENLFGAFTQPGPFRIQRPYERLDLQAWREFHGWDLEGREVQVEAGLDPETLLLTLRLDGGEARTAALRGAFSLDALF